MVRSELTADASFAAMRARSKLGIAMAAMIRIIATTISSSISEKPLFLRICFAPGLATPMTKNLLPFGLFDRSLQAILIIRPNPPVTGE